jgi:RNA polymerase primary sigma factor
LKNKVTLEDIEFQKRYIKNINNYNNNLTKVEEKDLIRRAKNGDSKAKEKLINSNLKFAFSEAKKYMGCGLPLSDLVSQANEGMVKAIDKYDLNNKNNSKFITCAGWWVRASILESINNDSRLVRLPISKIKKNKLENKSSVQVREEFKNIDSEYEMVENEYLSNISLVNSLKELNDKEYKVIVDYFGLNEQGIRKTHSEISEDMGLCPGTIMNIKEKALSKLYNKLNKNE